MFNISELISDLIYTVPAIFIALSCHEFGHAYAAYKNGRSVTERKMDD